MNLRPSGYEDADAIEFNTIEDVVYMSMKNDVSFLIEFVMNFYEQKSSFNPNMPMRFLIYAGMAYSKYIETNTSYHRYSPKQQKAPAPRCVCFYNGTAKKEDRITLKLSDAFESRSGIEVKVTMININYGHNKELLDKCGPLNEYSWFIGKIRENREAGADLETAVDEALNEMPDDFLIKPFLLANRAEVKNMCITEYDEERTRAEQREEDLAEGRAEGKVEGFLEAMALLVKDGILTIAQAAVRANMTVDEFKAKTGLTT